MAVARIAAEAAHEMEHEWAHLGEHAAEAAVETANAVADVTRLWAPYPHAHAHDTHDEYATLAAATTVELPGAGTTLEAEQVEQVEDGVDEGPVFLPLDMPGEEMAEGSADAMEEEQEDVVDDEEVLAPPPPPSWSSVQHRAATASSHAHIGRKGFPYGASAAAAVVVESPPRKKRKKHPVAAEPSEPSKQREPSEQSEEKEEAYDGGDDDEDPGEPYGLPLPPPLPPVSKPTAAAAAVLLQAESYQFTQAFWDIEEMERLTGTVRTFL